MARMARDRCPHGCGKSYIGLGRGAKSAHSRTCDMNPKAAETKRKQRESHMANRARGCYPRELYRKTPEHRRKQSEGRKKAFASGRLVPNNQAPKHWHGGVAMQSSWETALAARLDELGVKWTYQPAPLPWTDNSGAEHTYFPDFYLPDHDLYLEPHAPKFNHAFWEKEKWECLARQHDNLIVLNTLESCAGFSLAGTPQLGGATAPLPQNSP